VATENYVLVYADGSAFSSETAKRWNKVVLHTHKHTLQKFNPPYSPAMSLDFFLPLPFFLSPHLASGSCVSHWNRSGDINSWLCSSH